MKRKKSINKIQKAMKYEPLLTAVISKNQIITKLNLCIGRYFNYVLVDNDNIKYIGYTASLYRRLLQHKPKEFDSVLIMEFETEESARANERSMIKAMKPKSNYQFC